MEIRILRTIRVLSCAKGIVMTLTAGIENGLMICSEKEAKRFYNMVSHWKNFLKNSINM